MCIKRGKQIRYKVNILQIVVNAILQLAEENK